MQNLNDEWFKVYEKARLLWKEKNYDKAQKTLEDFWKKTGIRTLPQMVLYAYILRSKKMYISLINFLKETLEIFGDNAKELVGANRSHHDPSTDTSPSRTSIFLAVLYSLLGECYQKIGKMKLATDMFIKASELEPDINKSLAEISNAIFARCATDFSPEEMEAYYEKYRAKLKKLNIIPFEKVKYNHTLHNGAQKKIRVGYLSADLHAHPVADFSASLFLDYNREKFEIYIYNLSDIEDEVTKILKSGGGIWRDVFNLSFAEIAEKIRNDEIDILVDLAGHTKNNALPVFEYKPAPIQISGIGYVLSTGLFKFDGFLTDIYASQNETSPFFTEKLIRLNHTHFCYSPFAKFPEISEPPCLKNNYITFGSFNNFAKVTDEVLVLWNEILEKIPNSKMILKHSIFDSDEGLEYIKYRLKSLKILVNKFEFRGFSENYLSEYNDIDIALDTFPYTGGATSLEAMMMGAPVVTLAGNRHGSRLGVSFLKNLDLDELIAKDKNAYVEIAKALASDNELLTGLRKSLRNRMLNSKLCDKKMYMKELEEIFVKCVFDNI